MSLHQKYNLTDQTDFVFLDVDAIVLSILFQTDILIVSCSNGFNETFKTIYAINIVLLPKSCLFLDEYHHYYKLNLIGGAT